MSYVLRSQYFTHRDNHQLSVQFFVHNIYYWCQFVDGSNKHVKIISRILIDYA